MLRESMLLSAMVMFAAGFTFADEIEDMTAKLKSPEAKTAVQNYESGISRLRDDFKNKAATAKKDLLSGLEAAQKIATVENQLDEAILIRDIKKAYKSSGQLAPSMTDIHVISAFYGQNISWLDVTDKVRAAIKGKTKWSTSVNTKDWGEPAPGFGGPRTLMIQYIVEGKVKFKSTYQGYVVTIP